MNLIFFCQETIPSWVTSVPSHVYRALVVVVVVVVIVAAVVWGIQPNFKLFFGAG